MRVTGNVESGKWVGEVFAPIFNCHVPCKEGSYKKREVQHAKKLGYLKVAGKTRS